MNFESLIDKVKQAEGALEAQERQTGANWRQLKASWKTAWTPGRIVSVGLVAGFLVGRAEPAKRIVRGGGTLHLFSSLAGLFAGGTAQNAASQAEQAASAAEHVAVAKPSHTLPAGLPKAAQSAEPSHTPESLRSAGLL